MTRSVRVGALAALLVVCVAHAQDAATPPEAEPMPQPDVAALNRRIAELEQENRILRDFLSKRGLKPDAIIAAARGRADAASSPDRKASPDEDEGAQPRIHYRTVAEMMLAFPEEALPPGKGVEWGALVREATTDWAQENLVGKRIRVAAYFNGAWPVSAGRRVANFLDYSPGEDSVLVHLLPGKVKLYRRSSTPYIVDTNFTLRGHTLTISVNAVFAKSMASKLAALERQTDSARKPQVETVLTGRIAGACVDRTRAYIVLDDCELEE